MTGSAGIRNREASWELDGIKMEGTITYPEGDGPYAGVILVAGSGPTDRDWCSPLLHGSNGSGRLVATRLASLGYATMRFDKRGSGPRAHENAQVLMGKVSMESHMREVAAAVSSFLDNCDVDSEKLFALTNSEGAIHALNYQLGDNEPKFRGLVMTGVPARSADALGREQIAAQVMTLPNGEQLMEHFDRAMANFREGKLYVPDPTVPEPLQLLLRSITSPANQPFSRELFSLNPLDLLARVNAPMLLIIGKKDIQVNWKADGKILQDQVGERSNVRIAFPENCDHVLKYLDTPADQIIPAVAGLSYNSDSRFLDSEAMDEISVWLEENC